MDGGEWKRTAAGARAAGCCRLRVRCGHHARAHPGWAGALDRRRAQAHGGAQLSSAVPVRRAPSRPRAARQSGRPGPATARLLEACARSVPVRCPRSQLPRARPRAESQPAPWARGRPSAARSRAPQRPDDLVTPCHGRHGCCPDTASTHQLAGPPCTAEPSQARRLGSAPHVVSAHPPPSLSMLPAAPVRRGRPNYTSR